MKILLLLFPLLTSCGFWGIQKLETNDSKQEIIQDGESYTYIVVRLEFIEQVRQICEDSELQADYESEELYIQC
jgi:hypothetical protein